MMLTSLSTRTGAAVAPGEPLGDGEIVPARHDRRIDRPAAVELDRARHAHADPAHVAARPPDLVEQLGKALGHPGKGRLRPEADVQVGCALGQRRADEIAHRHPRMRGAEVGDEDDAGIAVEREHGRGTTSRGGAAAGLVDETLLEERVDPLRDRRAGEPGRSRQIGSRDCNLLADQA